MIKRTLTFIVLLAAFNIDAHTQSVKAIKATIDAGQAAPPISKRIYGQFIEHIAGIINTGIWAEMLEDRKFYNPITLQNPIKSFFHTLSRFMKCFAIRSFLKWPPLLSRLRC